MSISGLNPIFSLLLTACSSAILACTNQSDLIGPGAAKKQTKPIANPEKAMADQDLDLDEEDEEKPVASPTPIVAVDLPAPAVSPTPPPPPAKESDALLGLKEGPEQTKIICARPGQDRLRQVFCGTTPPVITSLADLQRALGLGFGQGNDPAFVFTGHSSSLVARFVTSLNPRAIVFTPTANNIRNQPYVAMGFTRGEQFAEIAANDPAETDPAKKLKFFIVHFQQACNQREGGCTIGELVSPAIESNWTGYTIYEDEDLKNTVFDCKHCHQPAGVAGPKMLRMQELQDPWTHFMRANRGSRVLLQEFQAAHGTAETYAGVPGNMIQNNDPADLEDLVRDAGFANQPNEFNTTAIEEDQDMAVWQAQYDIFATGNSIAIPYHQINVSDPAKIASMTKVYQDFRAGMLKVENLPDIRQTFKNEDKWAMGFGVKPNSTGAQILVQACSQCHNSKLDQSLSRAKFDVNLAKMNREEIELAVKRIGLPENDPKRMPPARFRDLLPSEQKILIDHLRAAVPQ